MAQFSVEIMRLSGSVLRGNQHFKAWKNENPEIRIVSWRVPADLVADAEAIMAALGAEPVRAGPDLVAGPSA